MPNWCAGVLKVRGTKENVTNFITKGIIAVDCYGSDINYKITLDKDENFNLDNMKNTYFYIKGTKRGFVSPGDYFFDFYDEKKDDVIVCLDVQFAWTIHPEQLAAISKQYDVAFKIYAFERGMEFNIDLEINKGEVIKEEYIEYDNYIWECIEPYCGG